MEKILINIIASDLDGTLLNKDFKLDSYIESCLDQLQKRKRICSSDQKNVTWGL